MEIRRLDNVERQLRMLFRNYDTLGVANYKSGYFQSQIDKENIPTRPRHEFSNILAGPSASEIDELADKSEDLEQRISSLYDSYETLKEREVELTEWRWVLTEAGGFFDRVRSLLGTWKAFAQADRLSRHMVTWIKSGNQQKTMTLRCYGMSSNSPEAKTVMLQAYNHCL